MKRFTVIGLGNFGFFAAKALFEDGNEVVAIDKDRMKVQAVDRYSTEAIVLEATEKNPGQWLLKSRITVEIEDQQKPALIADMLALYVVGGR